jgi:hypothetical protein
MRRDQQVIVAALRRRGGLLILLSLLVALGVIGMHQLSDGHMLVTTTAPANHHGHAELLSTAAHHHPERDADQPTAAPQLSLTTGWVLSASGDTCPDCNWHAMAEACLLALGLITALTTARPSTSRLLPTVPRPLTPQQPRAPYHQVRGAMSLSELRVSEHAVDQTVVVRLRLQRPVPLDQPRLQLGLADRRDRGGEHERTPHRRARQHLQLTEVALPLPR